MLLQGGGGGGRRRSVMLSCLRSFQFAAAKAIDVAVMPSARTK